MSKILVDLHTHSSASDGTDSPVELVRKAAEAGVRVLALTDHDTVSGLAEARAEAERLGLELIRGCEIAVRYDDDELHLLGLFLPETPPRAFLDALRNERRKRGKRNAAMLARLRELGMQVDEDDLLRQAAGEVAGRPHMAAVLLERHYVGTRAEAFERWLGRHGKAFVPRELLSPEEGIALLRAAGALPVLAHPCLSARMTPERLRECLTELKDYGLRAVEAYHSSHNNAAVRLCLDLAERLDLGVSGGSDYHGLAKTGIRLGHAGDGMVIPAGLPAALKALPG